MNGVSVALSSSEKNKKRLGTRTNTSSVLAMPQAAANVVTLNPPMSGELDISDMDLCGNVTGGLMGVPLLQETVEFEDEVELGPFVNNEFHRWFAGTTWMNE